jgi:cleavage and polyadenylation specificity factor subunit 1
MLSQHARYKVLLLASKKVQSNFFAIHQWRFARLNRDLEEPLHYSNNCKYVFTVIDRTSKWMEAVPLSDISEVVCSRALIFSWISCFRVPGTITSNRGAQFTSNVWCQLCEMLNIMHHQTTTYHPEENNAVVRLHCHLKDALCACAAVATWAEDLPWVLLGLHVQPREKTGLSPAEAVFGTPIV